MKILKLSKNNLKQTVDQAIKILDKGGIMVYPTETCYGLGGDASQKATVKKIFLLKKRKASKAITILVKDFAMARQFVLFDKLSYRLAKKYWPGPLTLVLPLKKKAKIFCLPKGNAREIGIRISPLSFIRHFLIKFKKPLITTSANISGKEPAYNLRQIIGYFSQNLLKPDLIIDAGRLTKRKTSTVVKVKNNRIKIIRQGPVRISQ